MCPQLTHWPPQTSIVHGDILKCMSTLQVRDVPKDVLTTLKSRAAAAGQSLSEYVLGELSRLARQPTLSELAERVRIRGTNTRPTRAADILRSERERQL